jgi:hypothetical protein
MPGSIPGRARAFAALTNKLGKWAADLLQDELAIFRCHLDENVWSAARLQGKVEGEKASLRKCIRPLLEINSPGHDELRARLSL